MKNRTPKRHSVEKIKDALAKLQSGRALSAVAKEIGISKGLLSYWKTHAETIIPPEKPHKESSQGNSRSQTFIKQCRDSINLAFKRLQKELKQEKPIGIRDLALTIAVLADKMSQATQNLQSQLPSTTSKWSVSEDTWMILKRHREAKLNIPPEKNIPQTDLGASGLEPQKKEGPSDPSADNSSLAVDETAQPIRDEGD